MSFLLTNPIIGRKRPQQILIHWHLKQYWRSMSFLCLQVSPTINFFYTSNMVRPDYAWFVVIRVLWFRQKNHSANKLTRILNDECKFDEYVHLYCLQILYERKLRVLNCHAPIEIAMCLGFLEISENNFGSDENDLWSYIEG